ncbi:ATP-dependent helicase [Actinomadura nitritigenes]|uniref:ATP-dependent helicase n=1 Tax=Actinomadura nitritigenes TaxID=134602 RepID=A0ABS3QS47_9ACTN|nr:ATP-dependent helicase [Actinomadura nitritigenes]MBO2436812.1 ATP-dependent helicase [Actinomadura nitritigenes]
MGGDVLERFSPATRAWFAGAFAAPTPAQAGAWESIAGGDNTLVVAPTGSGKTLAAFLWSLDRLTAPPPAGGADEAGEAAPEGRSAPGADPLRRCRVLYVSPLKALAVDVERNLRAPLTGIRHAARRLGLPEPDVRVGMRSGDTPADERRRLAVKPPDILITTPESLFLILTSRARESLRGVETVIVDEVHAVAGTKRGAHLALSLERLDALLERPAQRIGLSATVRPPEEVAAFLGGTRAASVVQPGSDKVFDLDIVVPVEDMGEVGQFVAESGTADPRQRSIWPHVEDRLLDLIQAHRSTLVFANSRRLAERLCGRLNELAYERATGEPLPEDHSPAELMAEAGSARGAPQEIARAHHGSVSKEERAGIENALKEGRLPAVVATSSLELGIDMGAVDLVVQVESPPSVASGLQRVGRAGHQVGAVSKGVIFPKYRGDLVQTAVVAERMRGGEIEELHYPRNPLDVLAQQIVAMVSMDEWTVDDLETLVKRAAPYATLPRSALEATLDMLAGRYPSDEFGELRPRLVWDRVTGVLHDRPGAQRLAVTSGGTIPDRGLFGVFLVGEKSSRVGELDEEMVYESRVGDVFVLGASSWRIEDITPDRVLVSPAPGQPGKLPFWHGDALGRPAELGRALGAFTRELAELPAEAARERVASAGLDDWAAGNLVSYLGEQREATGHVPDDRTMVVERFRDELGDWRMVVHSPLGARVHAPWALAIAGRLRERYGVDAQAMHADDGIVIRIPDMDEAPSLDLAVFDADDIERIVVDELGGSALFAARFRECAARSLLLPRRRPDKRMPLWQQRQRAAQLLAVASKYPSFPIVLETMRECLQDVFDVPGLVQLMRDMSGRKVRLVEVETPEPSPYARSLLFHYVGAFMYEGDSPLAERRAQALALDSALLAELLGQADLRELLDPDAVADIERELQRLVADRRARDLEGVADLLRALGPMTTAEVALRTTLTPGDESTEPGTAGDTGPAREVLVAASRWLEDLEATRRAIRVRVAGEERWAAIEDAARLRDALGAPLPVGVPEAFLEPVDDPLGDLVSRYARTHGPFRTGDVAARFGLGAAVVAETLRRLAGAGRVAEGEFLPVEAVAGPLTSEWCDAGVLRTLRRRSLARLRAEVEPSPPESLGRFLPAWHGIAGGSRLRGIDALVQAIEQLQGAAVPASALESLVLPSRVAGYSPAMLDELTSAGEVVWAGQGGLPGGDGWVSLYLADTAPLLMPEPAEITLTPAHQAVLDALGGGGALFFRTLSDRVNAQVTTSDADLATAVWDLVWAGHLTNDTLAPLRAALGSGRPTHRSRTTRRGRPVLPSRTGPPTVAGRWWPLPARETAATLRSHALAEALLERYGIVIRGAVAAERTPGGFSAVYPVLRAFEESGRCRRGYFVEGLGAAQFALPGAVDRLRALRPQGTAPDDLSALWEAPRRPDVRALVLAAADPANPYGAALPWPERDDEVASGHKPGRKAGALVVLVEGRLALYVERGGKTLLTWDDDAEVLRPAVDALALAVREGALGKLTVERADGAAINDSPLAAALESAGFHPTPRGLRLRA